MVTDILKGILLFFIHPILYITFIAAVLFGIQRVRRERASFGLKVYGVGGHIGKSILPGLLVGLMGSILLIGAGVALPYGFLTLITACYILLFLTGQARYITASAAVGLSIIIAYFIPNIHSNISVLQSPMQDLRHLSFKSADLLLFVTLLSEGFLVALWGSQETSPRLIDSKRGKKLGAHEANQTWLVPLFILIPTTGSISRVAWWPLTYTHLNHFAILLVPFAIGFQQLIAHTHPKKAIAESARWIFITSFIAILIGAAEWWFALPWLAVSAGGFVVISRLVMVLSHHYAFGTKPAYISRKTDGLIIVGVLPDTPAASMGLKIGERLRRVNDQKVSSELEVYEALQLNAAYCKIEVLDIDNEPRFVNAPIYQDDFHTIGLLFLEPSNRRQQKTS